MSNQENHDDGSDKNDKMETSESGEPIYRYDESHESKFEPVSEDQSIKEISDHIEKHVGEIDSVFHEILSDKVHIDVHHIRPTEERPYHTLVTSGLSDKPMNVPDGAEEYEYAELSICLPKEWGISEELVKIDENYWPIYWLKFLARFPHEYNSWLAFGHTIPNGDPAKPFTEGTKLNSMILLNSIVLPNEFRQLKLKTKTINFYSLIPLYSEEVELKLKEGLEPLFDGFGKVGVTDILDINRKNSVKRKKRFGIF